MPKNRLLTQLAVEKAKARPGPGGRYELPDGPGGVPGFALRVSERGVKTFALRYRINGRMRRITLGGHPVMSLAEARREARQAFEQIRQGVDPAGLKLEARRERERDSVPAVVDAYVERHLKRNTKLWQPTAQMLRRELLPRWVDRPVKSITRRDVLELLDAIVDRGSPVSANRTLASLRRLLNWSVERGLIEANPAAGVKPPHRERPRDRALDEEQVAALWRTWDGMGYPFGPMQKLLLLTGQRRGEVASMRWDQLDLDRGTWRLAAADTKARREHVVPLSPPVVEILGGVPRIDGSPLVFPANRAGSDRPVSGFSKAKRLTDRLSRVEGWTWHDLRRTAATFMARLNVPPHVVERILNHTSGSMSPIARVYNVHSYQSEMRHALEVWAREVERIVGGGAAKVVEMPRRAVGQ